VAVACRQNRQFLQQAVRYLSGEAGIRQFIDIGSGLPTAANTHQIAEAIQPDAHVVYIDYDAVVVAHGRALLETSSEVAVIHGDVRTSKAILEDAALRQLIDFGQPLAVLLAAVLHFIPEADDPMGIVETLKAAMAPGSYLVISHVTQDSVSAEENHLGVTVYKKASAPIVPPELSGDPSVL
jgi:O-methyltransferase involved in polyketide biosynthesis